jgi:hypothetical protein
MAIETQWTIAYRKPTANRLLRAGNFAGTWDEAADLARRFADRFPGLDVWYVPTAECDTPDRTVPEDCGNVLTARGRRVRIAEGGSVPDDMAKPQPRKSATGKPANATELETTTKDSATCESFAELLKSALSSYGTWPEAETPECQWFANCHNEAIYEVPHIQLGQVPTCFDHHNWLCRNGYFGSDGKVPVAMPPIVANRMRGLPVPDNSPAE